MGDPYKIGFLEEILTVIINLWMKLGDVMKSCVATVIYTWVIFAFLAVVDIRGGWFFVPWFVTIIFGYYVMVNADKWGK